MMIITRAALRARPFFLGRAVRRGKGILLHIHPECASPFESSLVAIAFAPITVRGVPAYKPRLVFWPDRETKEAATAPDIALVAGRPWFDGSTTHTRRRVEQWLRGRCECCGAPAAWPDLFDTPPPEAEGQD